MTPIPRIDDAGSELLTAPAAEDLATRFAGHLARVGVEPGARVVLQAPNSAMLLAAVAGCLRSGRAPVVIGAALTARERAELVADVDPALVVGAAELAEAPSAEPAALQDWFACRPLHFTSGTSGRPKAVWSGWLTRHQSEALVAEEQSAWGFQAETCTWCAGR